MTDAEITDLLFRAGAGRVPGVGWVELTTRGIGPNHKPSSITLRVNKKDLVVSANGDDAWMMVHDAVTKLRSKPKPDQ